MVDLTGKKLTEKSRVIIQEILEDIHKEVDESSYFKTADFGFAEKTLNQINEEEKNNSC